MPFLAHDRPYLRSVGDEPLPGYRLVAPLGQGGFGEVWKCVAPGGLQKAIKFVLQEAGKSADSDESSFRQEYEAFLQVKGIRHPFLLTLERVELIRDELIMVMELADESLAQRYEACRANGRPGIDRRQLLAYMVDIAEALDVLSGEHGLQHLDIKPANLFLMGGHVKVGDYGLVSRYKRGGDGLAPRLGHGLTPKYVAPEILSDRVDSRTDQYSLALVFFELLTGEFPYTGKSAQQLIAQHACGDPDLTALPLTDREAVAKALQKSPADRFPTCLAFVRALLENDTRTSGTILFSSAMNRRVPAPSVVSAPYKTRLTPGKVSGLADVSSTVRLGPTTTPRPNTGAVATEELALACPDLKFLGEGKAGPRGRLIRAADSAGRVMAVRILWLDEGNAVDLDELFRVLLKPLPGIAQDVVIPQPGMLAFVWDAGAPTLRNWLTDAPAELPRATVARFLEPLGPILDSLHAAAGFPHHLLSLSAIQYSDSADFQVVGFGVGEALRRSRPNTDWLADHPYAAPEARAGNGGPRSDQYALALIYVELRRAWFSGTPCDRSGEPRVDWDALQNDERKAVSRALAGKPEHRFESCAAFLAAVRPSASVVLENVRLLESTARLAGGPAPATPPPDPMAFASALVRNALGEVAKVSPAGMPVPVLRQTGGQYSLQFPVKLSGQLANLKLSTFTDQHEYASTPMPDGKLRLKPSSEFGVVELFVELPPDGPIAIAEMTVYGHLTSVDQGPTAVEQVVSALDTFRRAFQNADERRKAVRWRTDNGAALYPVDDELAVGLPVRCRTWDISATGFAVTVIGEPPAGHVFIAFDGNGATAGWAALARVVRTLPQGKGEHVVAGHFLFAGR